MIVEIEKPRPSCISSLNYNERKVDRGVAELVAVSNVPASGRDSIYALFSGREKTRYPVRELSFHASVNPSETDTCSGEDILDFISGLMDHLGLGAQPCLVYRHSDTGRTHYHVVSVRVDPDGRKINNFYEKQKASRYIESVSEKYHFTVPGRGEHIRNPEDLEEDDASHQRTVFRPGKADVAMQMRDVFSFALTYDFDGPAQLCCILEDLGIRAEETMDGADPAFVLQGLDAKGKPCTKPMPESVLDTPMYEMCMAMSISNRRSHRRHRREKERLQGLVTSAFGYSKSRSHFENILRNKGVTVHYSVTEEGDVFGITLVDHRTRCVFTASEIPSALSVRMMQEAVASGHWRAQDRGDGSSASYVKRKRAEARADAGALRGVRAVARTLEPVGQPHGNSWSGKTAKTEDDLREERDLERSGALNSTLVDHSLEEHLV